MKKLLVVGLLFGLAGCFSGDSELDGTWKHSFSTTDYATVEFNNSASYRTVTAYTLSGHEGDASYAGCMSAEDERGTFTKDQASGLITFTAEIKYYDEIISCDNPVYNDNGSEGDIPDPYTVTYRRSGANLLLDEVIFTPEK